MLFRDRRAFLYGMYPRVTSFDAAPNQSKYFLGGQRTSFLFKISLSTSVRVPPLLI